MKARYFVLDANGEAQPASMLEWASFMETAERTVARDKVAGAEVSTVFLGLDHQFAAGGPPLLFETMVFGGDHDGYQERHSTWDEAVAHHAAVVVALVAGEPPGDREPEQRPPLKES